MKSPAEAGGGAISDYALAPDTRQRNFIRKRLSQYLTPGKTLMFAHGFIFGWGDQGRRDVDVTCLRDGAGHRVREVPCGGGRVRPR